MIKNDNQLAQAHNRIEELERTIQDLYSRYAPAEARVYASGLEQEVNKKRRQIREYNELRDSSPEEFVSRISSEPIRIERLGKLLAKLRIASGLTQAQLAERLGWHQANLSRFESESYTSQTLYKIVEYVSSLDISLYVLPALTEEIRELYRDAETEHERLEATYEVNTHGIERNWYEAGIDINLEEPQTVTSGREEPSTASKSYESAVALA